MGNYNRGSRPGGGRGFWRRGFSGRDSSGPAQMFQAACDKCRMNCEVPFRPTNGRPIYCSNCFESNRGSDERRPFFGSPRGGAGGEDRQMFEAVCDECHNNCRVPFRPTSGKPIYCSNCFGDKKEDRGGDRPQNNDQFKELHAKLDKILGLLTPNVPSRPVAVPVEDVMEEAVVEEVKKPAKKKSPKKK